MLLRVVLLVLALACGCIGSQTGNPGSPNPSDGDDDSGDDDDDGCGDSGRPAGKVYVVSGAALRGTGELRLADAPLTVLASGRHRLGSDLAAVADLDGDGREELAVAASRFPHGAVFVVRGAQLEPGAPLAAADAFARIEGGGHREVDASSIGRAGDVDGDGADDLFVGPSVFFASTLALGGILSIDQADVLIELPDWDHRASLANAGDRDHDGLDDLWAAVPATDDDRGAVYLFVSGGSVPIQLDAGAAHAVIRGEHPGGLLGSKLHTLDDLDGDGAPELVLTADIPGNEDGPPPSSTFHWFNSASITSGELELAGASGTLTARPGAWVYDALPAGDLDGDGAPELALSVTGDSNRTWLLTSAQLRAGGAIALDAAPLFPESPHGLLPAGDLDGDGTADVVLDMSVMSGQAYLGGELLPLLRLRPPDGCGTQIEHLSFAGDLDGDGLPDLVLSAPEAYATDDQFSDLQSVPAPCAGTEEQGDAAGRPRLTSSQGGSATSIPDGSALSYQSWQIHYEDTQGDVVKGASTVTVFVDGVEYWSGTSAPVVWFEHNEGFVLQLLLGPEGLPYSTDLHYGVTLTDQAGNVSNCINSVFNTGNPPD